MPGTRNLRREEVETVLTEAQEHLADRSVGFVRLSGSSWDESVDLGGSGTFVKVGDVFAILTADHVVTRLPDAGDIGLVINLRPDQTLQKLLVDARALRRIRIAKASNDSSGPDLAAVVLPPSLVSTLAARVTFHDLLRNRDRMLGAPMPDERGIWVTYGFPGEWVELEPPPVGTPYSQVTWFKAVAGAINPSPEIQRGDFDYFELVIQSGTNLPNSFGGMSGGGLWRLLLRDDGNGPRIEESLLTGVLFYEDWTSGVRKLICHGRRSVYQSAVDRLQSIVAGEG